MAGLSGCYHLVNTVGTHGDRRTQSACQTLPPLVGSLSGNLAPRGFDTRYVPPFHVTISRRGHGRLRPWLWSSTEIVLELRPTPGPLPDCCHALPQLCAFVHRSLNLKFIVTLALGLLIWGAGSPNSPRCNVRLPRQSCVVTMRRIKNTQL